MKRFYKETAVDAGDGGHRVLLDGKLMRTPAKAVLVLPTRALAEAIAAEWREVPEKAEINVSHLALTRLAAVQPQVAELVQLRYFGGLTVPAAAAVLGISPRTADGWWAYARGWLAAELERL